MDEMLRYRIIKQPTTKQDFLSPLVRQIPLYEILLHQMFLKMAKEVYTSVGRV
jgi:hypothetical protein